MSMRQTHVRELAALAMAGVVVTAISLSDKPAAVAAPVQDAPAVRNAPSRYGVGLAVGADGKFSFRVSRPSHHDGAVRTTRT